MDAAQTPATFTPPPVADVPPTPEPVQTPVAPLPQAAFPNVPTSMSSPTVSPGAKTPSGIANIVLYLGLAIMLFSSVILVVLFLTGRFFAA